MFYELFSSLSHSVLEEACLGFDSSMRLGQGGFGEVFRGKLNGQDVAVKRILVSIHGLNTF